MGPDLHWFPEDVPLARLSATLAAMANTAGGAVILGVSPRSGHVQGVQVPADTLDRVFQAALMVEPPLVIPLPKVQRVEESQVVWVTIPAGLPHVYSVEGRFLWREGAQSNPMPAREMRRLLMERGVIQFESRVPPGATLANLDGDQVEAYAQTYRSILHLREGQEGPASQEILLRRGCLQQEGDLLQPAYSALLLFGSHPQRWLPTATILAARFSGTGFADRFVKQDITGSLPEQLRQAESFVKSNLQSVVRLVGLTHQETLEYPLEAVRELLVNAAAHRDYNAQGDSIHLNIFSDRLEVTSPGSLPGPVTLDNLLKARFSRNPIIVQLLSDLGFVERLGYGLDRVVSIMWQSGLRPPRFEELAGSFRVTLFNAPLHDLAPPEIAHYRSLDLNPRQEAALNFLLTQRRITNSDYQELCPEVHPESLRRDLADLVSRGVLIKIGDKRATYYILK